MVLAASIGLMVSQGPIIGYTFGIFLKPLGNEFGWQRGQISSILTVLGISYTLFQPVAGRLIDRFGPRFVLIPAVIGFGSCVALLGSLPGVIEVWYLSVILLSFFSACSGPLPYAKLMVSWFDKSRGLALGLAISGIGIGTMIFPSFAQKLIDIGGRQLAFFGLGAAVLAVGLPLLLLFIRDTPQTVGLGQDGVVRDMSASDNIKKTDTRGQVGLTPQQAMRTPIFWLLAASFFLVATAILGTILHLAPLLTDRGETVQLAAAVLGVMGVFSTVGRLMAGLLLDRIFAPKLAIIFFMGPVIACLMLAGGVTGGPAFICAALLGLGVGAEVDIIAYVVSRYFGVRYFTEIYGFLFAAFSFGIAIGPLVMGYGYDFTGGYVMPLILSAALVIIACLLLNIIGPYPDWKNKSSEECAA